jgi:hypothetical protein
MLSGFLSLFYEWLFTLYSVRLYTRVYARKQDLRRGGITPLDGSQVTRSAAILVLSLPLMREKEDSTSWQIFVIFSAAG